MNSLDNTSRKYKIYKYTNLITRGSYIGQTCQPLRYRAGGRSMIGYRGCEKFWEAIEGYGTNCWHVEILWEGLTLDEANIYENLEIHDNETLYPYGYNLNSGGMESERSPETIAKMSKSKLGMSPEAFTTLVGRLLCDGWSQAKIAHELRKNSRTIGKYTKLANLKKSQKKTSIISNRSFTGDDTQDKNTIRQQVEISVAAWMFANKTQDVDQIAKEVKISAREVRRYAEDPLWDAVLNEWNYEGPRHFRVRRAGRKKKVAE